MINQDDLYIETNREKGTVIYIGYKSELIEAGVADEKMFPSGPRKRRWKRKNASDSKLCTDHFTVTRITEDEPHTFRVSREIGWQEANNLAELKASGKLVSLPTSVQTTQKGKPIKWVTRCKNCERKANLGQILASTLLGCSFETVEIDPETKHGTLVNLAADDPANFLEFIASDFELDEQFWHDVTEELKRRRTVENSKKWR